MTLAGAVRASLASWFEELEGIAIRVQDHTLRDGAGARRLSKRIHPDVLPCCRSDAPRFPPYDVRAKVGPAFLQSRRTFITLAADARDATGPLPEHEQADEQQA